MEHRDQALLGGRPEVDEHVAAAHQVELGERRVPGHVVPREHHHVADPLADLVAAVDLPEVASVLLRDGLDLVDGVDPGSGLLDVALADVGGKDLDRQVAAGLPERCGERQRDAVGLLSRGAARHPHAHLILVALVRDDPRQDDVGEDGEGIVLAKEVSDHDEDVVIEVLRLGRMGTQVVGVLLKRAHLMDGDATSDAAVDRARAIGAEVDAGRAAQDHIDLVHPVGIFLHLSLDRCWIGGVADEIRMPAQACKLGGDARRVQDHVHGVGADGGRRHTVVARRRRVLRERDAAPTLDRGQAERSIRGGPRQHDADGARSLVEGQRTKEVVYGKMHALRRRALHQAEATVKDRQVLARRYDVDVVGLHLHVVLGHEHGHAGAACQDLGQDRLVLGGEVLDEHQRDPRVRRQVL